jgi:hypothetical protein
VLTDLLIIPPGIGLENTAYFKSNNLFWNVYIKNDGKIRSPESKAGSGEWEGGGSNVKLKGEQRLPTCFSF